jgi:hypothetical protein
MVVSGPLYAQRAIQEKVTVQPGRQISPQDEMTISASAVKVLRHIADARGALEATNPDVAKASEALEQSGRLLDIIDAALPTARVKDRIWVAKKHLEYKDTRDVLPDLVPIYSSLDELVDYVPTAKAKAHLDAAKKAMQNGDKSKADEQPGKADDALLYLEADLPLKSTHRLVDRAKAALAKNDVKAADKWLASAEDGVVFVSMSFDSPLTRAKAALYRAWQDYDLGASGYAKADLKTAVDDLERAAQSKDKVTREAAADLVSEVRDIHEQIASAGDKGMEGRIENAWQRVKAISERSAEYISTGWQRLRAAGAGKKELIEAKLQLSYARIDRFNAKDAAAAKVDLADAEGYIDAAAKRVNAGLKPEVSEVSKLVAGLDRAMDAGDTAKAGPQAFGNAESHLAALIRQL